MARTFVKAKMMRFSHFKACTLPERLAKIIVGQPPSGVAPLVVDDGCDALLNLDRFS